MKIRRLDEETVNRIAAGEVIARPWNAVKELIENSLDAGSTEISLICDKAGFKSFSILDNGKGILKEDLEICCERFTTSKLRNFEDLAECESFGFRGEALSSISHVSKLQIETRTKDTDLGYRAKYEDGKLVELEQVLMPRGTRVSFEDLFLNQTRRRALNTRDEYSKILELVVSYALANPKISFEVRQKEKLSSNLLTSGRNFLEASKVCLGPKLAENLTFFEFEDEELEVKAEGWISTSYRGRNSFTLFVNSRLVSSKHLQKTIAKIYDEKPFLFLKLQFPTKICDVNVHPTKEEVRFPKETQVLNKLSDRLLEIEKKKNQSEKFEEENLKSKTETKYIPTRSRVDHLQRDLQDCFDKKQNFRSGERLSGVEKNLSSSTFVGACTKNLGLLHISRNLYLVNFEKLVQDEVLNEFRKNQNQDCVRVVKFNPPVRLEIEENAEKDAEKDTEKNAENEVEVFFPLICKNRFITGLALPKQKDLFLLAIPYFIPKIPGLTKITNLTTKNELDQEIVRVLVLSLFESFSEARDLQKRIYDEFIHLKKPFSNCEVWFENGTIQEIASLDKLYRVFERC